MNKKFIFIVPAFVIVSVVIYFIAIEQESKVSEVSSDLPFATDETGVTPEGRHLVTSANSEFALNLYTEQTKITNGNIIFSPFSLSTTMAMTYEGARGNTAKEIQAVFHFPFDDIQRRSSFAALNNILNQPNEKFELCSANSLWAQFDYKFLDDYTDTLMRYYAGEIHNVDFKGSNEEARQEINKWVLDETNGKIDDLFEKGSLSEDNRLVLINAIYFKGAWKNQFDKDQTKDENFRVSSSEVVQVPMMRIQDGASLFKYGTTEGLQVIEMPYDGNRLSMMIILPINDDISTLENNLSLEAITDLRGRLMEQPVDVFIPRFKIDMKYFMADTLAKMGMSTAFSPDADFSGIDGQKGLFVGGIIHQAYMEVNEEGTEAAAATGVDMLTSARPVFRADHPFLFIIQDMENGNIIFMGRIINPKLN